MGKNKSKKIRNWKARQVVEGVIDDRETKELAEKVIIDDPQVKQKRKKHNYRTFTCPYSKIFISRKVNLF